MFLVHPWSCTTSPTINFRTFFITPKRNPHPLAITPQFHSSPSPMQSLIYFPSEWICLFWIVHIKGIIPYAVLSDWLLPLTCFQRLSMLQLVLVPHSFLLPNNILLHEYATFHLSIHLLMAIGCLSFLRLMNNAAMNTRVQDFVWTRFHFSQTYI